MSSIQIATVGVGLTVMVKFLDGPTQPAPDVGVTVIVATTLVVPLLVAVKAAMLPVPLAAKPILVLLLVQPKVAPAEPVKVTRLVDAPLQRI